MSEKNNGVWAVTIFLLGVLVLIGRVAWLVLG